MATQTALDRIKDKQTKELDKAVEEEIKDGKKTHWMWWYFPIPTSVLVKGLSSRNTEKYALTEADTMGFIKNKKLYEKYRKMVEAVDYDTFFDKEDDKRKFKESIFHFLHFSIDLVIYYDKKDKNSKNLVIHTTTERGNVFNNIKNEDKAELKKKADNLITILRKKKKEIQNNDTNHEYITEQWFDLERKMLNKGFFEAKDYKVQLKNLKKEVVGTDGAGDCFFYAILNTINGEKQFVRNDVIKLRKDVIDAMIKNQDVKFGKNVDPKNSDIDKKSYKDGDTFSSMTGWGKGEAAEIAVNEKKGKEDSDEEYPTYDEYLNNKTNGCCVRMTWKEYTKHMAIPGVWADNRLIKGMSFYLNRKIYIISKTNEMSLNVVFDPIEFIKD